MLCNVPEHWKQALGPMHAQCISMLMSCSHPTQFWWLSSVKDRGGKRTMKWRPFPAPQAAYWWHSFGASTFLACSAKKNGQVEIRLASPLSMSLLILFGPLVCQCFAMFQLLNFDLLNLFTACWDDWTGQNALVFKPDTAKDCLRIRLLHYQSLETHSLAVGTDRGPFFPEQSLSQRCRIS